MLKGQSACLLVREYLGHVITVEGVQTNPRKVATMQQWPIPKDIKSLRGVFGAH